MKLIKIVLIIIIMILVINWPFSALIGQVAQIGVDRINSMPDEPAPYLLRDWSEVGRQYDSFVYDLNKAGEYLPLIFIEDQGINYPGNPSFGLNTYVGSFNQSAGEAINILPSLVGASLLGIDKSNQDGKNWILYSQDFFNHKNGENLYLNNVGAHSGSDWWYDMMPNIYFYQLYDLYGDIGEAEFQFSTIADRMQNAIRQMGGSDTPWQRPSMNYRAWNFIDGRPLASGVVEPEAAGTFAWLLYHAYKETGNKEYLKGTEWSLEFLTNLGTNPSYELQLPYGAYVAAKANAEIGTNYDIEKLLFWIFNRGPLRGWGTIVGTWSGLDVSGLVGEANDLGNDYAFQLNGLQQAGALVPMVRYDKRFARSIAKWVLNLANANRLFYPGFLPSNMQDGSGWSSQNDPRGVLGYEALREKIDGVGPISTGDALKGQWAGTNLSLYSTSSIGYLGSLIEETNVPKILQIDLLKTDFFEDAAFPSFLFFNPYADVREIELSLGEALVDIYDALSEEFILQSVSGQVMIPLPGKTAMSLVYVPAGGQLSTKFNKLISDGTVIDYNQTKIAYNFPPRIQSLAAEKVIVEPSDSLQIFTKATDRETKELQYTYGSDGGLLVGEGSNRKWIVPDSIGIYEIQVYVEDSESQTDTATLQIEVVEEVNFAPEILELMSDSRHTVPGGNIQLNCVAYDQNSDLLTYTWSAEEGTIISDGDKAVWTGPENEGIYVIKVSVTDEEGATVWADISLLVLTYEKPEVANLIAYYPFDGNADDLSGNQLNGLVSGAKLTKDRNGNSSRAYFFDGINDHISVSNTEQLNFDQAITVSLWIKPEKLPDRETFIISHGSWQNRFKLSIIPDRNLRWTLKNSAGQIVDLDSKIRLVQDSIYFITASYDGHFLMIYINGQLESFTTMTGSINKTDFDLEIAQQLPGDQAFNFGGILDEIKLYDYALSPDTILQIYGPLSTSARDLPLSTASVEIYPNPVSSKLSVKIETSQSRPAEFDIVDQFGRICNKGYLYHSVLEEIDVHEYAHGIYYLLIKTQNEFIVRKFIKI
ncbi:MAG: T9SS type A sorting domain-containing protein [Saprospiraceae bacterium]|nr:T9SS type A sorting domain-containing protein [Saprospiraceae bacterium]